jgi:hypothetical protein
MKSRALILITVTAILGAASLSQGQEPRRLSQGQEPHRHRPLSDDTDQFSPPVPSDEELQLLKKDIGSQKKQIIAANMNLTDGEAEKFWPIYDQYTAELSKINDQKVALIKEYLITYNSITDEQAESYVHRWAAIDQATNQLRTKYFPIFHRVLSGKSTALFFQMDHRLALMIDLQLTSRMPILEP